jgi:hypothetical protein
LAFLREPVPPPARTSASGLFAAGALPTVTFKIKDMLVDGKLENVGADIKGKRDADSTTGLPTRAERSIVLQPHSIAICTPMHTRMNDDSRMTTFMGRRPALRQLAKR